MITKTYKPHIRKEIYMITKTNTSSQEKREKDFVVFLFNCRKDFKMATSKVVSIFNYLLLLDNCFDRVFPSHDRMAQELGMSLRQAERVTKWLKDKGYIQKIKRPYTSCIFIINPMFKNPYIREGLKSFFKAFCFLPLSILISSISFARDENYTDGGVINLFQDYINNNLFISSRVGRYTHEYDRTIHPPNIKKRKEMEKKTLDLIPKYVQSIKTIRLARNGMIELSIFPESAIRKCLDSLSKKGLKTDKNKFFYLRKACVGYCADKQIRCNIEMKNKLRDYYKIRSSDSYVEELEMSAQEFSTVSMERANKRNKTQKREVQMSSFSDLSHRKSQQENPVITWVKIEAVRASAKRKRNIFASYAPPGHEKPNVDQKEAYEIVEQYKQTEECKLFEQKNDVTVINLFSHNHGHVNTPIYPIDVPAQELYNSIKNDSSYITFSDI